MSTLPPAGPDQTNTFGAPGGVAASTTLAKRVVESSIPQARSQEEVAK